MVVGVGCAAIIVVALVVLGVIVGGLLRRLKDLDTQLATARAQLADFNEVLARTSRSSG